MSSMLDLLELLSRIFLGFYHINSYFNLYIVCIIIIIFVFLLEVVLKYIKTSSTFFNKSCVFVGFLQCFRSLVVFSIPIR